MTEPTEVFEPAPLAGVRVVDLTEEVGELCGRLLADLGADVVRVEPPGGSPSRALPPRAPDGTGLWWLYRNSNKRGVVVDLDEDADRLHSLLAGADVLLDSAPPGVRAAQGLDVASLSARYPELVVTSITWFGLTGPYASYAATDDVVVGMSGWLSSSGVVGKPPLLVPGTIASDGTAVMATFAVLAALWQRRVTGRGQVLDVSAFEATVQIDTWSFANTSAIVNAGMDGRRVRNARASLYPTIRTRDGWIRLVLLSARQWRALWAWMGSPEEFADPMWDQVATRFANADVLHPMFDQFFAPMEMVPAATEAQRRGIVAMPILTPADQLVDDHFRARRTFVETEAAPGLVTSVAAGFIEVDGARAGFRRRAPEVGEHDADAAVSSDGAAGPSHTPDGPAPERGPLAGLRVLDFGHGGVGVEGGRLFAEHGADVVKIESRAYPDFMRLITGGEMTPSFASSSRSKRSFGVNLKHPEGRAALMRLVAVADVVIENNSTGTMASLGVGWDDLHAVNPALVYVSSQLLGSRGPRADWTGYGPSVQAYGGLTYLWSYPDEDGPLGGSAIHPDLFAGHLCAVAGMAGLLGREGGGAGSHCEVAQAEALACSLGDLLMAEALAPGSIRPDGNDDDRGAPWGVYQCAGDEEWCVICVRDDADWVALRKAMGDPAWAGDERFSSPAGRLAARRELDGLVGAWTADRSPEDVAAACQAHGVPAGPMRYASELLADPHLLERGFPAPIVQPDAGPLTLDGPAFLASDMAPARTGPAPRLGEHTREICAELLGMDDAEVDRLIEAGALEVALEG